MTKGVQKAGPHLVLLGNLTEEDSLQQSLGNLQVALCCKWVCVCVCVCMCVCVPTLFPQNQLEELGGGVAGTWIPMLGVCASEKV